MQPCIIYCKNGVRPEKQQQVCGPDLRSWPWIIKRNCVKRVESIHAATRNKI